MRILLIGEYSRLHNSLKEGLEFLGCEVTIMAGGDGFKKYPVDNSMPNFDVVQLINESSIKTTPKLEIQFLKQILKKTEKLFLLSCGIDYVCMDYMTKDIPKYSLMSAYLRDNTLEKKYQFQLQYLEKPFKELHDFLLQKCSGVITSDLDYHLPYLLKNHPKYLGLIPNPINLDVIRYSPLKIDDKINIFHGINSKAIHKKGNNYFTEALKLIKAKYKDKVVIVETQDLPYKEYIQKYDECHILLDQVYGYDQGYNALEAMAKGKVVLSGAEQEWVDYYNVKENTILINVLPDTKQIYDKLEFLIDNPERILQISINARKFIEKEHNYIKIAKKYIENWNV